MRRNVTAAAVCLVVAVFFIMFCSVPALAISESDVQAQVDATSRETVAGNLFIWFLCAIAFLKISQKIDSFMSSLGINVGHTGGSMVAEAMLATRGMSEGKNFLSGGFGGKGAQGMAGIKGAASAAGSFMGGGLSGIVSRQFGSSAIKSVIRNGGGIGAKIFNSSMAKGGDFANNVTGTIAKGSMNETGSMTGANAAKALSSYMGYNTQHTDAPEFSNVEIGGGRITGTETTADNPSGVQFSMYHADQYMAPEGTFNTVDAAPEGVNHGHIRRHSFVKRMVISTTGQPSASRRIVIRGVSFEGGGVYGFYEFGELRGLLLRGEVTSFLQLYAQMRVRVLFHRGVHPKMFPLNDE